MPASERLLIGHEKGQPPQGWPFFVQRFSRYSLVRQPKNTELRFTERSMREAASANTFDRPAW
jgi:hypothetical protein